MKTIESKTAETVLQSKQKISISGKEYEIASPTLAVMIEVSKLISKLPILNDDEKADSLQKALAYGVNGDLLADIIALLIVGYKKGNYISNKYNLYKRKKLSTIISNTFSNKDVLETTAKLLEDLEVGFFLSTTIFLNGVNLLRKTKS